MRTQLSLVILFAILLQATSCMWVWLGFAVNYEYINTNLCVNRFAPAVTCSGYCYLELQVEKEQGQQATLIKVKDINWNVCLPPASCSITSPFHAPHTVTSYCIFNISTLLAGVSMLILKPPIVTIV